MGLDFSNAGAIEWREAFDFFLAERLGFSVHPAVPLLERPDTPLALSPQQHARLLLEMLDCYVAHRRELVVASFDQMCRGVAAGEGHVCTFRDCLGMFLAIDPAGDIYPCQRFCGRPAYRLGTLAEGPGLERLLSGPVAGRFRQREELIRAACSGCPHIDCCLGGCPYNAWAGGTNGSVRDPRCEAYRAVFDRIQKQLLEEARSEENLQAVAERPYSGQGHPLFRKGPLIELAREGPHPSRVARNARRIVAAVELARGPDIAAAASRLAAMGIRRTRFRALLPLGRAQDWPEPPTAGALGAYADPMEVIENGFDPVAGCGLGQNLYVEPSGDAFPCRAYHQPHAFLGNAVEIGLGMLLDSPAFRDLATHTVDTNAKCRRCEVRYLCGGACRAWGGEAAQQDLDSPPGECTQLRERALALFNAAQAYLKDEGQGDRHV